MRFACLLHEACPCIIVQEHNSKEDQTHTLSINKFADWHREEFLSVMLPNYGKIRPALPLEGKQALMHKPRVPEHMLPSTVDWRGTGADSPVKDQASCGSCWVSHHSAHCMAPLFSVTTQQLCQMSADMIPHTACLH